MVSFDSSGCVPLAATGITGIRPPHVYVSTLDKSTFWESVLHILPVCKLPLERSSERESEEDSAGLNRDSWGFSEITQAVSAGSTGACTSPCSLLIYVFFVYMWSLAKTLSQASNLLISTIRKNTTQPRRLASKVALLSSNCCEAL